MARLIFYISAALLLTFQFHDFAGAQNVGVNYGRLGDNLPPPTEVIELVKSKNISRIRIFDPNPEVLTALKDSGIELILGVVNNDLPILANDFVFPTAWVQSNVIPYAASVNIRVISAGNELIPSDLAPFILPAIQALQRALTAANLTIPVSTVVSQAVIGTSYPPSAGAFSDEAAPIIVPIVQFLQANNYPLLCNIYPYFAYASNPVDIKLEYALLSNKEVSVTDGPLGYTNLIDAQVDATYTALERVGAGNVEIIVTETGWPTAGADIATIQNAQTYNNNVVARLKANIGTPKRPERVLQIYIFALFNEDQKASGIEQNWGLFQPSMAEVYPVTF